MMSEQQKEPQKRRLTQKEVEQLRRKRDLAYKKKLQQVRQAEDVESREEIFEHLHQTRTVEQPKTFAKKWENYWYHYTFVTILLVAILSLVGWFVYEMVTRESYDMNLLVLTGYETGVTSDDLQEPLSQHLSDEDGDGDTDLYIDLIVLDRDTLETQDTNTVMAMTTRYTAAIGSADYMVYLLDESYYDFLVESGVTFMDLTEISDNPAIEGDRYPVADDADFAVFENREDLYLVLRYLPDIAGADKEEVVTQHETQVAVVQSILAE